MNKKFIYDLIRRNDRMGIKYWDDLSFEEKLMISKVSYMAARRISRHGQGVVIEEVHWFTKTDNGIEARLG